MISQYIAHYPIEDFDVVDIERTFEIPLPDSDHTYTGKFDGVVRGKTTHRLRLLEHKTEKRGSKNNTPEVWAARTQVGLYLAAGEILYGEPFDDIILDVLTRRSPGQRIGPTFRRDTLQRNEYQRTMALKNITWVADQITRLEDTLGRDVMWPQHTENCCKGGFKCDMYELHVTGEGERSPFVVLKYFKEAERYLDL